MAKKVTVDLDDGVIVRYGILDCQVCVPKDWSDKNIKDFVNSKNPSNTQGGWHIRTSKKLLNGDPVRNTCVGNCERIHVMLDC